jgi:AcrR family transcriptional regulator
VAGGREALVELVAEKGPDRVTVQDVIDRADLSRATFYAHFCGKDDLLLSGLEELEQLRSLRAVVEHVEANRSLYRAPWVAARARSSCGRFGAASPRCSATTSRRRSTDSACRHPSRWR